MFPPLLLWHPHLAASLLQYRIDRVDAARHKAQSYGKNYRGIMFPWESAATGEETCPTWARTGKLEQHITADIALAVQQHWRVTGNRTFLGLAYPGLVKGTADFWASRVDLDQNGVAHIRQVVPPDEFHFGSDSAYTNYVAKRNLLFADEAARLLHRNASPEWRRVANALQIPYDPDTGVHPEYAGYRGQKIRQADVVLLGFPLEMQMEPATRRADLTYYAQRTDPHGPAMTWAMHAIGHLELGDMQAASVNFNRSFSNAQPPFKVWTELPGGGGAVNFLTGMGGFLQAAVFGLPGLRIREDHLELNPSLVDGMESVTVRGIHYQGIVFNLDFDALHITLHVHAGALFRLSLIEQSGATTRLAAGELATIARGKATVRVDQES
jgi:trehalose/maltose hydrolase-like predicted phosphorylase